MNYKNHPCSTDRKAFTLIELLTVIAVIGILAAIIIPTVGNVRKSARTSQAIANAKQIGMSNLLYSQENRNRLLGQNDTWNGTVFMFRNMARYLVDQPTNSDQAVANALGQFVDPLVPEPFRIYGQIYPYTWAINRVFNTRGGRSFEGTGAYSGSDNPRLINEFMDPSTILYAVSGGYEITLANAAEEGLVNPPTARQAIFYYHRNNKATVGVYLDGHTEVLNFPISPRKINPRLNQ